MKFVIFGLTVSSSWGNGHATLWRAYIDAMVRRGHRVVFFERDLPFYQPHRDLHELPGAPQTELSLYENWEIITPYAREQLCDADVAMVTSYCPDALPATDLVLESRATRVFYDLDTPVTLDRLERGQTVEYIGPRGLQDFDWVLSYTGGTALDRLREELGARRVAPLYGCVNPQAHQPGQREPWLSADLTYLGTYATDRQAALDELFLKPAAMLPQRRFLIGGALYPRNFPWSDNIYFVQHVPPPVHAELFASCRLTLNITREAMARLGHCPSGRLFEAAACGTAIVSDPWQGIERFFTPGREILIARDRHDTLAYLSLSDAELRRIRTAARERALVDHTADRRIAELESMLSDTTHSAAQDRIQPAPIIRERR